MSEPDYKHWATLDTWNMTEAALLIDGKDPLEHKSNGPSIRNGDHGYASTYKIWDAFHRTNWESLFGVGAKKGKLSPRWLVSVARQKGFAVPPKLLHHLEANAADSVEQASVSSTSASTKERNTMLQLILGLAHAGFNVDLDGNRNTKAKQMREALERCGLGLDDSTIKKYLDEARQLRRRILAERDSTN
ncbi:hypothetical protein AEMCBJ_04350 [Cupriavidus necator]|uniref:hypothetical protein n=1 Tax=Cupriavidus necator TaxID=106590 RepID=UPI003F73F7BF